ncbi:MAG: hypothetical protein FWH44_05355 [Methanomassiliicoccaceae archaeon]|nr:hypothetical protein [Methanomassiliicoccaceae archaeon]
MQLIDFVDACDMGSKSEIEVFELLCYYRVKETGNISFSVKKMMDLYGEAGLTAPDRSSLEKQTKKHPLFKPYGIEGTLRFAYGVLDTFDRKYGHLWSVTASPASPAAAASKGQVQLMDFADACGLASRTDAEAFELLCYYLTKSSGTRSFIARDMLDLYGRAGLPMPDRTTLEKMTRKHSSFRVHGIEGALEFVPGVLGSLDARYAGIWTDVSQSKTPNAAPADAEIISEERFCGRRDGLDKMIKQINSSYRDGSFDACALVMRRLLEAVIILAFQSNGIEDEIRDGGHLRYEDIVRKAAESGVLALSKKGIDIAAVSKIGDYSGKGATYTFGANDINAVRVGYRNAMEALYDLAKL